MILDQMQTNKLLFRQTYEDLRVFDNASNAQILNDALDYFELKEPFKLLAEKMKARGAIGVKKKDDEGGYETYEKQRVSEQIGNGEYEKVVTGLGRRIVSSMANLFSNKTQKWEYLRGDEKLDPEELETLQYYRQAGNFQQSLIVSDWISCALKSSLLMPIWSGNQFVYQPIAPQCVHFKFGDTVIDGDVERGFRYNDIRDASVVVIDLGNVTNSDTGSTNNQYLAIFGKSKKYPLGRHVTYVASDWQGWPSEQTEQDWVTKSGELANPLTWVSETTGDFNIEYPLVIFLGDMSLGNEILPTSTTLYENCLEIDTSVSNILRYSMQSAHGNRVLTNEGNQPLPRCLDGAIGLAKGQTYDLKSLPISNAQGALQNVQIIGRSIAEGYSVPGYMVFAESIVTPESGVALMIRTQPLIELRDNRIGLNNESVSKIFDIERALHFAYTNEKLLDGVTQQWDPGRWIMPEDQTVKGDRLKKNLDNKAISYVRYIRDMHDLATDDDAVAYIETMQEQDATIQPPKPGLQKFGQLPRPELSNVGR